MLRYERIPPFFPRLGRICDCWTRLRPLEGSVVARGRVKLRGIPWRDSRPGEARYLLHTLDRHDGGGRVAMLGFLSMHTEPVLVTHLEREFLGVSPRNVRTLADRMTAEGWLERCQAAGRVSYRVQPEAARAVVEFVQAHAGPGVELGRPDPTEVALEIRRWQPQGWSAPHLKGLCHQLRRVL